MSSFDIAYKKIKKTLLSEQENQEQISPEPTANAPEAGVEPQLPDNQESEIKNIEEESLDVNWIQKIIKLLTLLNKEDQTVQDIISNLSKGEVNGDTLKQKSDLIDDLIRTIPSEKNI